MTKLPYLVSEMLDAVSQLPSTFLYPRMDGNGGSEINQSISLFVSTTNIETTLKESSGTEKYYRYGSAELRGFQDPRLT